MARSLRVAADHLARVHLALKRCGYPSQKTFAADVGPSLSTVKKFLKGEAIDYENFRELCDRLELEWQTIVHLEAHHTPAVTPISVGGIAPFNMGTPVSHPACFFGRTRELSRCFGLLKRHPLQNIAIIGQRRSGKTSLLKQLACLTTVPPEQLRPQQKSDWLPHPEQYRWIFVDFQDARLTTREGVLRYLAKALGIATEIYSLDTFMESVSDSLHRPTVILLDEIGVGLQRCPDLDDVFWESLRSLATNQAGGNLAFVLASHEAPMQMAYHTGHSSPFFNIFGYTTTLGALGEDDARALIASSPIPFSREDTAWILKHSGGWPFLVQILCTTRLMALEHPDPDHSWQAEGLCHIAPFQYLLD